MKIETSTSKEYAARTIAASMRANNRILIELEGEHALAQVVMDFDGLPYFTKTNENLPGVREIYEGYSRVVSVTRNDEGNTIRLMLEKTM